MWDLLISVVSTLPPQPYQLEVEIEERDAYTPLRVAGTTASACTAASMLAAALRSSV